MDKPTFWKIIDASRAKARGNVYEHIETLQKELEKYDPDEIVSFARIFDEYWVRAYTHELWGAAYIIGGGCGDSGFLDFRGWLISKGEQVYEAAMADPESLLDVVTDEDDEGQVEGFHYAASKAWEARTGKGMKDFPGSGVDYPREPAGESWHGDDDVLMGRFPRLAQRFQ